MITIENGKGLKTNECFVIVNEKNCIVDYLTFKNNRRKSYWYSPSTSVPNQESQFITRDQAILALSKCKRIGFVKKLTFIDTDVSMCYGGGGANILGYDFLNEKIWIESPDKSKYGYDYRNICLVD